MWSSLGCDLPLNQMGIFPFSWVNNIMFGRKQSSKSWQIWDPMRVSVCSFICLWWKLVPAKTVTLQIYFFSLFFNILPFKTLRVCPAVWDAFSWWVILCTYAEINYPLEKPSVSTTKENWQHQFYFYLRQMDPFRHYRLGQSCADWFPAQFLWWSLNQKELLLMCAGPQRWLKLCNGKGPVTLPPFRSSLQPFF